MEPPAANPTETLRSIRPLLLLAVTALGLYGCYRLALPFVPALAWALALAVLFAPLQRRLEVKLKRPSLAATVAVILIGLTVVVPTTFVGQQLVQQAASGAESVAAKASSGEWRQALAAQPRFAAAAEWVEQRVDLPGSAKSFAAWLSAGAGRLLRGSVFQLIGFGLTFYLLFFFLRDRVEVLRSVRALVPLSEPELDTLFARISDTIHATIYGALAVSAVQGLLGGLMFWWLGLSAPLLWGVVMALLAVVPMLGAFVVWIPAALLLALEGSWGKALILTLWGMLVVGTVDNLLRPILVGRRLRLHTVLAFISVVGGLLVFGPAGLVLGPLTLTITTSLLDVWRQRTTPAAVAADEANAVARFENEGGALANPTSPKS